MMNMTNELQKLLQHATNDEIDNVIDTLSELSATLQIGNGNPENPENRNGIDWQIVHELQNIVEKLIEN